MKAGLNYRAYLLRLWPAADTQWRASLEDPHTGERRAFATLEQLWEYLNQVTQAGCVSGEREPPASAAPELTGSASRWGAISSEGDQESRM